MVFSLFMYRVVRKGNARVFKQKESVWHVGSFEEWEMNSCHLQMTWP